MKYVLKAIILKSNSIKIPYTEERLTKKQVSAMEKELLFMILVGFTKDNGKMTRGMEEDLSFILMETPIQENTKMAKPMVKVFINGVMGRYMMDNLKMVLNREMDYGRVYKEIRMLVIGLIIKLMAMAFIFGWMEINTKVNGKNA